MILIYISINLIQNEKNLDLPIKYEFNVPLTSIRYHLNSLY